MQYDKDEVLDFSIRPYEEWIHFLFEQELRTSNKEGSPFLHYEFVNQFAQPAVYVEYLTRLFHDLPKLVEKYGVAQIDQGLWGVSMGIYFGPSINELLWYSTIPIDARIACIRAMKLIFSEVLVKIPPDEEAGTSFEMWWDNVGFVRDESTEPVRKESKLPIRLHLNEETAARDLENHMAFCVYKTHILPILIADEPGSSQECLQRIKALKGQIAPEFKYDFDSWTEDDITDFWNHEKPLINAAFETLKEILELGERLPDCRCQDYALHGLGHLLHPKKPALVQDYIDRHREEWDQGGLEWLEACRDGSVM